MIRASAYVEFARLSLGAGAIGRAAELPPLRRPAANHYRQHGSTHEWGRGVPELGMLSRASIHADGRRDLQSGFYLSDDCLPERLGRRLRAGGSFGATGPDCRPVLADIHALDHSLNDAVQALKAHSKVPFRYVHKRSGGLVVNVQFPVGEVGNV